MSTPGPASEAVEIEAEYHFQLSPTGREFLEEITEDFEAREGVRGRIDLKMRDGLATWELPPDTPEGVVREIEREIERDTDLLVRQDRERGR